jgi:pimeloyl-ACP methyl ester carboxylesterase
LTAIARRLGIQTGDVTAPTTRWARGADGVRLHALDWGGAGAPVLLMHGGALCAHTWDYVALGLRAEFRLIAMDLRGHGESAWADEYSVERCIGDARALLDVLSIPRAHVVGMSLGGIIAVELTAAQPERVTSLALIDIAPGSVFGASAKMRAFVNEFPGAPSLDAAVEMALRVNPRSDPEQLRYRFNALLRQDENGVWVWKRDARRVEDYPEVVRRVEGMGQLAAAIEVPFLMVRGGRSKVLDEVAAAAFAARFVRGRWTSVSDAGHNVQEDKPLELISLLRAFWEAER